MDSKEVIMEGINEVLEIRHQMHRTYLKYIQSDAPIHERFEVFQTAPEDWKGHGDYIGAGDDIPGWNHRDMHWERYRNIYWEWIIEHMAESSRSGINWDSIPDDLLDEDGTVLGSAEIPREPLCAGRRRRPSEELGLIQIRLVI